MMWALGAFLKGLGILCLAVVLFGSSSGAEAPANENPAVSQRDTGSNEASSRITEMGEPLALFLYGFGVLLIATAFRLKFCKKMPSESQGTELPIAESRQFQRPFILGPGNKWKTGDHEAS